MADNQEPPDYELADRMVLTEPAQVRAISHATYMYTGENNECFPPSIMTAPSSTQTWEYLIIQQLGGTAGTC